MVKHANPHMQAVPPPRSSALSEALPTRNGLNGCSQHIRAALRGTAGAPDGALRPGPPLPVLPKGSTISPRARGAKLEQHGMADPHAAVHGSVRASVCVCRRLPRPQWSPYRDGLTGLTWLCRPAPLVRRRTPPNARFLQALLS